MTLTPDLLRAATGCTAERAALFAPHLAAACEHYAITGQMRLAAFLPQIGHESGGLQYVREIASGEAYEGRADLGNSQPGDGVRYKGRGLIQCTGRSNYRAMTVALAAMGAPDFEQHPDELEKPRWAAWSAAAWWATNGCNALADRGDYVGIGRLINRGNANATRPANGEADRLQRWERAKAALAAHAPVVADPPAAGPPAAPAAPSTHWPAGDSPDWPDDTPKEPAMPAIAPIIGAVLPYIVEAIPRLGGLFGSGSKVAERNLQAAETVVGIVQAATGAVNAQDAAERIRSDPAALAAATRAVETHWFDIHKAAEDSAAAARQFSVDYAKDNNVRVVAGQFTFLELLSLLLVVASLVGGLAAIIWGGIDPQLKGAIVTLMLIGGYTAVTQFWFGSSQGSKKKDDKAS